MLEGSNFQPDRPADEWAERCDFWSRESVGLQSKRLTRERNTNPLILTGHGCSLRIDGGALIINQGFTHYPQKQECHRYFKGDLALPRIIVLLDGSGSLSFDVLSWLGEQGVALARIKWNGDVAVFASGAGFVADAGKLRWQYETQADETLRYGFARNLVRRKLLNSIAMLKATFGPSRLRETAVLKARDGATSLQAESVRGMNDIRAIEGECAAAYFAAWADIEMRWTARSRYPVSDQWRTFRSRSSILTGRKPKNWKASHPINAMLNYAYAVRAAQLQIQAVADGFDPYAGIMHHSRPDFPAYVYDLIEPERPKVDAEILAFVQSRTFSAADFVIRSDGACRLTPQLARVVATLIGRKTCASLNPTKRLSQP
jgi:CRISPR-associated protein Cas1